MTTEARMLSGEVLHRGMLDMQVCVPKEWTDDEVNKFAESENPCGSNGWFIRQQGDKGLKGADERVMCAENANRVHIMLDA